MSLAVTLPVERNNLKTTLEIPAITSDTMTVLEEKCNKLAGLIKGVTTAQTRLDTVKTDNKTWTVGLAGAAASVIATAIWVAVVAAAAFGVVFSLPVYMIGAAAGAIFLALTGALDLFTGGILAAPENKKNATTGGKEDNKKDYADFNARPAWQRALLMLTPYGTAVVPNTLANARKAERSETVKASEVKLTEAQTAATQDLDAFKALVEEAMTTELDGNTHKDAILELKVLQERLKTALEATKQVAV